MIRIAVLVSGRHGRGSNLQAIADACADGRIDGNIVAVIGNFAESPALIRAQAQGLQTETVRSVGDEAAYGDVLLTALKAAQPDLICLAGYIRKLPSAIIAAYPHRIMNMHNALLPSFGGQGMYGVRVHQAVLEYGAKISGCTVHFVDEQYDNGPIILQAVVPVRDEDTPETLAARVLTAEHQAFPQAIALFAQGKLRVEGRCVRGADNG